MKLDPLEILMIPAILLLSGCLYVEWREFRANIRPKRWQAPRFKRHSDFTYGRNGRLGRRN